MNSMLTYLVPLMAVCGQELPVDVNADSSHSAWSSMRNRLLSMQGLAARLLTQFTPENVSLERTPITT